MACQSLPYRNRKQLESVVSDLCLLTYVCLLLVFHFGGSSRCFLVLKSLHLLLSTSSSLYVDCAACFRRSSFLPTCMLSLLSQRNTLGCLLARAGAAFRFAPYGSKHTQTRLPSKLPMSISSLPMHTLTYIHTRACISVYMSLCLCFLAGGGAGKLSPA